MNIAEEIQARLNELRAVYADVLQQRARWEALQTVELVSAEYTMLLAQDVGEREDLDQRKKDLQEEKRRLSLASEPEAEPTAFPIRSVWMEYRSPQDHTPQLQASLPPRGRANRAEEEEARLRFKKLVNRWAYSWRMDTTVLGQVNRIVDAEGPLGEALSLLNWSVFAGCTHPRESEEAHLARLEEWGAAVMEYSDRLASDIGIKETRFQRWLHIWELWQRRGESHHGQATWLTFIAESRRAIQDQIAQLKDEIHHLEEEIARLKAYLQERGGSS